MSEKKLRRLNSLKLEKIIEIIDSLWGEYPELEIIFEDPKEFRRERDEFIYSLEKLISYYLNVDFISEEDIRDCIFNAIERFIEAIDLRDELDKVLPPLYERKLERFIIRYPKQKKYWKVIISSEFERKWHRIYLNVFILEDDLKSLQFEFVVPKEIFKKLIDDKFFEEVEVEQWWEKYVALRTNCKKLLEDKLYRRGEL